VITALTPIIGIITDHIMAVKTSMAQTDQ
jgi:hypothetical protein